MTEDLLARPSDFKASSFFGPKDYLNSAAILFEPTRIDKQVPNSYQGQQRDPRDEAFADITVFETQADLEAGKPSKILKNAKVVHGYIVEKLERVVDRAIVGRCIRTTLKNGATPFNLDDVDDATLEKVRSYLTARAEAVASAPAFD